MLVVTTKQYIVGFSGSDISLNPAKNVLNIMFDTQLILFLKVNFINQGKFVKYKYYFLGHQ